MDLLNVFQTKKSAVLGLDIGVNSVRLVELNRKSSGKWVLERCAAEPMPSGVISADGSVENLERAVDVVQKLIRKSGTKVKNVVAALPASSVITRKVTLPSGLRQEELERQVEEEAEQYIPFALDEVSLDFCVVGPSRTSAGDDDIVIVAAKRDQVDDVMALVNSAGLDLKVLDVSSLAMQSAAQRVISNLSNRGRDALVVLAQIGTNSTNVCIVRNGEVVFEREQPLGGLQLTQHIAKQYGMSQDEAEVKKVKAQLPDDYAHQILMPYMERLAGELKVALQAFYNSTPYNKVDYVMLSGGGAILPRLSEVMTENLGVPCVLVNPFEDMDIGDEVQDRRLRHEAPAFLTACGLAMRGAFE